MAEPDEPIQVWYLIGTLSVGGAEKTLVDLVSGLEREQFAPTVWTIAEVGPLADDLPDDVPVRSLGATSKADLRAPLRFVRALRAERPGVLQSFLFFDNLLASLAGIASRGTAVVTGVREVPERMPSHRDFLDRVTIPLSDRIVSNSEAGACWVVERGADPDCVDVVPNGRDVSRYADAEASETLRRELGLNDGPVVGTVGRLVERKGGFDLLDAWTGVRASAPDAQLLFVGDGPEREALEAEAGANDCRESVVFAGVRDDVPEILDLLDVFVLPSHYEGSPGALLEAMCAGVPIVTTPVDGSGELIRHEREGLHVPPRDPDALAAAIGRLLAEEEEECRLAEAAQQRARDSYARDRMVEQFQSLYTELR